VGWPKRPGQKRAGWALPEPPRLVEQVALLGPVQRVLGGPQVEDAGGLRVPGLLGQVGSYGIDAIVAYQGRKAGDCVELDQG
jgi:hypothetical protein